MTPQNFTQKSLEAVQTAQSIATTYGSQQVEQCHLLLALLEAENGLVPQLITGMGLTLPSFHAAARALVERQPRVSGPGREPGKIYISQGVDQALNAAQETAKQMKDEYVSVEHLLLALLKTADRELAQLLQT